MSMPIADMVIVRCFHGRNASGNLHLVIRNDAGSWTQQHAIALSIKIEPAIVVLTQRQAHGVVGKSLYTLSYFCNGTAIRRCGSGSLAAARALLSADPHVQTPLSFSTQEGEVQVVSAGVDLLGYKVNPLSYARAAEQRSWQGVVNQKVRNVVLIGGSRDYCLIELPGQSALRQCRVNAQRLALISRRALIVTAAGCDALYDYALRYFSPQYGLQEDSATGSAHAMAAAYWQSRFSKPRMRALQRSAAGGEFSVQRAGLAQCVYGRAEICPHDDDGLGYVMAAKAFAVNAAILPKGL